MTNSATAALIAVAALVLYIVAWPVPIDPVAWEAPIDYGLSGVFDRNAMEGINNSSTGTEQESETEAARITLRWLPLNIRQGCCTDRLRGTRERCVHMCVSIYICI